MSERLRSHVYAVAISLMAIVIAALIVTSPSEADRIQRLGNSIKCPVCQGESIADSPSAMARDMMALVRERVADGRSDEEIIDEVLGAYSGAVLLDPPVSGSTLILWIAPGLALIAGAGVILWWERHPGEAQPAPDQASTRSTRRMLVGGLALAAAFGAIVVAAGFFLQDDRPGPASGVAQLEGQDLENVSNETMEAVITANQDNPQIDGMRLALAERYFDAGDYRAAFPHYLAVAESETSSQPQQVEALVRLGWMAWDGNQEIEPALGMFDQALAVQPNSSTAMYLKGKVIWCGVGDLEQAGDLFATVVANGDLPSESLALVESELQSVERGEPCA